MSLPQRDGVNGRYYLIHKPNTDSGVLEHADQCIQDVLNGTQKKTIPAIRWSFEPKRNALSSQPAPGAVSVQTAFEGIPLRGSCYILRCLRRLVGWREIGHTLGKYIKHQVQERFFEIGENEDYFSPFPLCTAWPELRPEDVDENLLRFTCYVAVCYTVYGASDNTVITEHYLGLVSQLRPDMVKELKTNGVATCRKISSDIRRTVLPHRP